MPVISDWKGQGDRPGSFWETHRGLLSGTALSGAALLLAGESSGMAIDFTSDGLGQVAVKGHSTNLNNVPVDDFLTQSGTSTKWVRNAAGLYVEKAAGTVAIEYDDGYYALVEPAATNLCLQSNALATTPWGINNATIDANNATGPDGLTSAERITESGGAGNQNIYQSIATISSATDYTLSVYAKAGTQSFISLYLTKASAGEEHIAATFDILNGALGETDVGTTSGTIAGRTITAVGNGWYRCTLTGKITEVTGYFGVSPVPLLTGNTFDASGEVSYTGTGKTVFLWGAQLELGTVATSPIPTFAAAVTRAADNVNVATSAFPLSATAGTLIASLDAPVTSGVARHIAAISNGTVNESILFRYSGTNPDFTVLDGLVTQAALDAGTAVAGRKKFAAVYAADDFAASYNGGAVATDTSGTLPTVTTLNVGCGIGGGEALNGKLFSLVYLPRRMSNADLQARTAA